MLDAESKFYQFLESHNIELREPIEYGRLVKYTDPDRLSRNKKDKPHWYIAFFNNDHIWAKIGSHSTDNDIDGYLIFKSYNDNELTSEQIEDFKHRSKEASIAYKEEMEAYRLECKKKSQENWAKCTDADPKHPYLVKKNLPPTGVKQLGDMIIVPAYSADELVSYQRIYPDSTRKNMKGAIKGCYCPIGDIKASDTIYVSESWSTSCTAHHVTGKAAIATFGAGNLVTATVLFKDLYPNKRFVMIQDDNEAGKKAADEWRAIVKQEVIEPTKPYIDLNDLYVAEGADAVKEALKVPTLPIFTPRQIIAKNIKPIEWVVNNLFSDCSVNIIYGEGGCGKTMKTMEICYGIATGTPVFEMNCEKPRRVLYIDGELGEALLQERLKEMEQRLGELPDSINMIPYDLVPNGINIDQEIWQKRIDPLIERNDVIVFDNWYALTSTVESGSQNIVWKQVFRWMKRHSADRKCFIVLHHATKADKMMRGSSDMKNDCDTILGVEKNPENPIYLSMQVSFDKGRRIRPEHQRPYQIDLQNGEWLRQKLTLKRSK